jgi:heptosyltransferase-2
MKAQAESSVPAAGTQAIVLAPFANERIREWPLENFRRFIDIGIADGHRFVICGAPAHRVVANELVRSFRADFVDNRCGLTSWPVLRDTLKSARFVVSNNSGIAHLTASMGQWVLCVFGGRHSWQEWMPLGPKVLTIARMPTCSPCDSNLCPNNLVCLRDVDATMAYLEITSAISRDATSLLE